MQNRQNCKSRKQNFQEPEKNKNNQKQQNRKYFELSFRFPLMIQKGIEYLINTKAVDLFHVLVIH